MPKSIELYKYVEKILKKNKRMTIDEIYEDIENNKKVEYLKMNVWTGEPLKSFEGGVRDKLQKVTYDFSKCQTIPMFVMENKYYSISKNYIKIKKNKWLSKKSKTTKYETTSPDNETHNNMMLVIGDFNERHNIGLEPNKSIGKYRNEIDIFHKDNGQNTIYEIKGGKNYFYTAVGQLMSYEQLSILSDDVANAKKVIIAKEKMQDWQEDVLKELHIDYVYFDPDAKDAEKVLKKLFIK